ncbi:MAG: glutamate--tRNA ligase family protein, partial [Thermoanaerobaculia bacterium]
KLSKRKLDKYLKNPEFAELYQHGRRIADRLKLEVSPETFNPVITDFYRIAGFLPDAILNYLLLLGWSLDDKTEMLSPAEQIANFSLERVGKSAASFDPKKLLSFQERYMQALSVDERLELVLPYLTQAGWIATPVQAEDRERVRGIVAAAGDRIKVSGDILDYDEFFVADEALAYDPKAFDKRIRSAPGAVELLAALRDEIAALPAGAAFDAAAIETLLNEFVAARGLGLGAIIHAVRVAVAGKPVGFGLFDILALLGRERVLARLARIDSVLINTSGKEAG